MKADWINCNFEDILTLKNGFAFKSDKYSENGTPVIRISDINDAIVKTTNAKKVQDEENYENYLIEFGDILIAMSGATTGKFGIYKEQNKAYQNQRVGNFKLHCEKLINKNYIYYLLYALRRQIEKDAYGGAQPNISSKKIEAMQITLAPLLEQKAIVAKIEQLFSELDNAIANLKTAKAKLKIYRQAVLKKAFEGIAQINFEQIIQSSQNGLSKRSGKEGEFYKVLRLADIKDFQIVENEPRSIQMNENEIEKYKLEINDLICTRVNGSKDLVGTFTLYHNDTNWAFCDHFIRLKLNENSISKFYFYFLKTREVRKYIHDNMVSSAGQNTVSQTTIKAIQVPTCSIEEQNQIVQEIESRLSVCDKIEETIENSLAKSEALRQSILKKAFEGKLLSEQELENIKNHPDFESAEELLKRIKKERNK